MAGVQGPNGPGDVQNGPGRIVPGGLHRDAAQSHQGAARRRCVSRSRIFMAPGAEMMLDTTRYNAT